MLRKETKAKRFCFIISLFRLWEFGLEGIDEDVAKPLLRLVRALS